MSKKRAAIAKLIFIPGPGMTTLTAEGAFSYSQALKPLLSPILPATLQLKMKKGCWKITKALPEAHLEEELPLQLKAFKALKLKVGETGGTVLQGINYLVTKSAKGVFTSITEIEGSIFITSNISKSVTSLELILFPSATSNSSSNFPQNRPQSPPPGPLTNS